MSAERRRIDYLTATVGNLLSLLDSYEADGLIDFDEDAPTVAGARELLKACADGSVDTLLDEWEAENEAAAGILESGPAANVAG